ncbi:MAG: hypothetical protein M1828_000932 [Chrysothrix sp. TS-e1954]|nr:MAG: hypothetical protein M1828_000932 [Chrysothrix sp. TS-e1954]
MQRVTFSEGTHLLTEPLRIKASSGPETHCSLKCVRHSRCCNLKVNPLHHLSYSTHSPPSPDTSLTPPSAAAGKTLLYITNNSTTSRTSYASKLSSFSLPHNPSSIFTSSLASAIHIRSLALPAHKNKTFVLGEAGIDAELSALDLPFTNPNTSTTPQTTDWASPPNFAQLASRKSLDPAIGAVLLGLDFHLTYTKLAHAFAYLQDPEVHFLMTNDDATLPHSGALFPGAGACSAPLLTALGPTRQPTVLGKPATAMLDAIEVQLSSKKEDDEGVDSLAPPNTAPTALPFQFTRKRTIMIGDRLSTDIAFGNRGFLGGTLAVLSGVASRADVENARGEMRPAYFVGGVGDLLGGF